jgi:hypothetical protein
LLQTPTTVQTDEPPEKMRARAEKNGYKNGTKFGSLTSQIKYDPKAQEMLYPTPQAFDSAGMTETIGKNDKVELVGNTFRKVTPTGDFWLGLGRLASLGLLPTPIATDIQHKQRVQDLKAAGGQTMASRKNGASRPNGLSDFIHFYGILKTPCTADSYTDNMKSKGVSGTSGTLAQEIISGYATEHRGLQVEIVGKDSRLSPLFTEEMMGFPLMWTALPFLSESGEPSPSRPTATQ